MPSLRWSFGDLYSVGDILEKNTYTIYIYIYMYMYICIYVYVYM